MLQPVPITTPVDARALSGFHLATTTWKLRNCPVRRLHGVAKSVASVARAIPPATLQGNVRCRGNTAAQIGRNTTLAAVEVVPGRSRLGRRKWVVRRRLRSAGRSSLLAAGWIGWPPRQSRHRRVPRTTTEPPNRIRGGDSGSCAGVRGNSPCRRQPTQCSPWMSPEETHRSIFYSYPNSCGALKPLNAIAVVALTALGLLSR
jgi:hypothetical protein